MALRNLELGYKNLAKALWPSGRGAKCFSLMDWDSLMDWQGAQSQKEGNDDRGKGKGARRDPPSHLKIQWSFWPSFRLWDPW